MLRGLDEPVTCDVLWAFRFDYYSRVVYSCQAVINQWLALMLDKYYNNVYSMTWFLSKSSWGYFMQCCCGGDAPTVIRRVMDRELVAQWLRTDKEYQPLRVVSRTCEGCGRVSAQIFSLHSGQLLRTLN